MPEHYDVIVIGSGAGGGTLTYTLGTDREARSCCSSGVAGIPRERRTGTRVSVWGDLRYRNAGHWVDQNGKEFNPKQHYYVGGNTKVYGAVLFRMRERDFGDVYHVDGVSPAWPIKYRTSSRGTRRRNSCTPSTANEASIRSTRRRRAVRRIPP